MLTSFVYTPLQNFTDVSKGEDDTPYCQIWDAYRTEGLRFGLILGFIIVASFNSVLFGILKSVIESFVKFNTMDG